MSAALGTDNPTAVDLTESKQGELRATCISITLLAALFVGLRFVARARRGTAFGMDDFVLVVALVFLSGLSATVLLMIHHGMGLHAQALTPDQLTEILKTLVAQEIIYVTTNGLIKVSLLIMYCRIFTLARVRWQVYTLGFLAVGWSVSIVFVSIFQCNPIKKAWNPFMPGDCIQLKAAFIATGVPNIVTDILILCVPIPLLWGLHTSAAQRLSLIFIFLLGSFVVFASIYRFITIFEFQPIDTSWTLAKACTWCLVECSAGVISVCLPTLRPLVRMLVDGFETTPENNSISNFNGGKASDGVATVGGSNQKSRRFRRIGDDENLVLRPEFDDGKVTSRIERSQSTSSGDEIPLNAIGVRTNVEWTERPSGVDNTNLNTHRKESAVSDTYRK